MIQLDHKLIIVFNIDEQTNVITLKIFQGLYPPFL